MALQKTVIQSSQGSPHQPLLPNNHQLPCCQQRAGRRARPNAGPLAGWSLRMTQRGPRASGQVSCSPKTIGLVPGPLWHNSFDEGSSRSTENNWLPYVSVTDGQTYNGSDKPDVEINLMSREQLERAESPHNPELCEITESAMSKPRSAAPPHRSVLHLPGAVKLHTEDHQRIPPTLVLGYA